MRSDRLRFAVHSLAPVIIPISFLHLLGGYRQTIGSVVETRGAPPWANRNPFHGIITIPAQVTKNPFRTAALLPIMGVGTSRRLSSSWRRDARLSAPRSRRALFGTFMVVGASFGRHQFRPSVDLPSGLWAGGVHSTRPVVAAKRAVIAGLLAASASCALPVLFVLRSGNAPEASFAILLALGEPC